MLAEQLRELSEFAAARAPPARPAPATGRCVPYRLLLRLYPARWRARYGDEFAAILEERPLGPFDVADVLLGALDAQLHLRGLGAASQHAKGFAMSLRIGGYAAISAASCGSSSSRAMPSTTAASRASHGSARDRARDVVTLVALIGLSAFQARSHPVLTWAAFAIPAAGGGERAVRAVAIVVTGESDPVIFAGLSVGRSHRSASLAMLVGSGLFALATWRTRSLSRRAAAPARSRALLVVSRCRGAGGSSREALVASS